MLLLFEKYENSDGKGVNGMVLEIRLFSGSVGSSHEKSSRPAKIHFACNLSVSTPIMWVNTMALTAVKG